MPQAQMCVVFGIVTLHFWSDQMAILLMGKNDTCWLASLKRKSNQTGYMTCSNNGFSCLEISGQAVSAWGRARKPVPEGKLDYACMSDPPLRSLAPP